MFGVKANPFFVEMATPQKAAGKEMFHENYDMLHFGLLSSQVLWTFSETFSNIVTMCCSVMEHHEN